MIWEVHVVLMGEGRGMYRVLVGKPKGKRPLGRPGCRSDGMDWIELTLDRGRWQALVNVVMNLWVIIIFLSFVCLMVCLILVNVEIHTLFF
jgi:hypothetical protein